MTGPEHYTEAERLVALVKRYPEASDAMVLAVAAQAHATLAHAAATAMAGDSSNGMALSDFKAWDRVAGVPLQGSNS